MVKGKVDKSKVIWIGLVHVTPKNGSDLLGECLGAFVNIVGFAKSKKEFSSLVKESVEAQFNFKSISDVSKIRDRIDINDELIELSKKLSDKYPILADEFHRYIEN